MWKIPLVQICFIRHLNAPKDPALRDIRQKYSLKAEMHLKGKWSKEKWKKTRGKEKLPGLSRSSKSPAGVAAMLQVYQGGVQQSGHIPPPQPGAGNPEGTGATPALGTRHVPRAGIDEASPRHSSGGGTPDSQDRDVGRRSWVKWCCWGRGWWPRGVKWVPGWRGSPRGVGRDRQGCGWHQGPDRKISC